MFNCSSCMRRCLKTFIGDAVLVSQTSTPSSRIQSAARKTYLTVATSSKTEPDAPDFAISRGPTSRSKSSSSESGDRTQLHLDREEQRQKWLDSRGQRPAGKPATSEPSSPRALRKELIYLKDPLKLAEAVRTHLREDNFAAAEELVKAASKDVLCTVSWNHLVDYLLSKGKISAAIKTYNDVCTNRQFEYRRKVG